MGGWGRVPFSRLRYAKKADYFKHFSRHVNHREQHNLLMIEIGGGG